MAGEILSGLAGGVTLIGAIIIYRATVYALTRGAKMPTPPKDEQIGCQQCGKLFDPNHKPCMCRTCEQVALTKPGSTRLQQSSSSSALAPPDSDLQADAVNPAHYKAHPSGVECIEITEHFDFCLGNAIKYIWRAGLKQDAVEDLKKARWYLDRAISQRGTQLTALPPSDQMQWLSRSDQLP